MTLLAGITNAVWHYISPVKPDVASKTRSSVSSARTPSPATLAALKRRRSMSPISRVNSWGMHSHTQTSTFDDGKRRGIFQSVEADLSTSHRKSPKSIDDTDATMMLDETLVDSPHQHSLSSRLSDICMDTGPATPIRKKFTPPIWQEQDAWDETAAFIDDGNEPTMSGAQPLTPPDSPTGPYITPPTTSEQIFTTDLAAFPLTVQPLILHLLLRGREPLLPSHWTTDFRFLPASLFHTPFSSNPTICALNRTDFRAQRAFRDLLYLGGHIRDRILVHLPPEPTALDGVKAYLSWATKDAATWSTTPALLVMHAGDKTTDPAEIQLGLARKMLRAAREWAEHLHGGDSGLVEALPTQYGVVVSHSLMAFVSWTPTVSAFTGLESEDVRIATVAQGMQSLGMFDFGLRELDVWNALAVALLVVHVRDEGRGYTAA